MPPLSNIPLCFTHSFTSRERRVSDIKIKQNGSRGEGDGDGEGKREGEKRCVYGCGFLFEDDVLRKKKKKEFVKINLSAEELEM